MATKRLKRGKPIRVPAAGTVTINRDGAVMFKATTRKRKKNPAKPARRKTARKAAPKKRKPATKKRTTKRTSRRARR